MMKRFLIPVVALAALCTISFATRHQDQAPPVPLGKSAPDISVKTLDGKMVKLSSLRGKPVFLDFWATWCGPCRMSLPHTQKLAADHGKDITVLAISAEDVKTIQSFMKDNKYSYPAYRDPKNDAMTKYNVQGIPTFVVIDKDGNLVDYLVGYGGDQPIDDALAKVGIK